MVTGHPGEERKGDFVGWGKCPLHHSATAFKLKGGASTEFLLVELVPLLNVKFQFLNANIGLLKSKFKTSAKKSRIHFACPFLLPSLDYFTNF